MSYLYIRSSAASNSLSLAASELSFDAVLTVGFLPTLMLGSIVAIAFVEGCFDRSRGQMKFLMVMVILGVAGAAAVEFNLFDDLAEFDFAADASLLMALVVTIMTVTSAITVTPMPVELLSAIIVQALVGAALKPGDPWMGIMALILTAVMTIFGLARFSKLRLLNLQFLVFSFGAINPKGAKYGAVGALLRILYAPVNVAAVYEVARLCLTTCYVMDAEWPTVLIGVVLVLMACTVMTLAMLSSHSSGLAWTVWLRLSTTSCRGKTCLPLEHDSSL